MTTTSIHCTPAVKPKPSLSALCRQGDLRWTREAWTLEHEPLFSILAEIDDPRFGRKRAHMPKSKRKTPGERVSARAKVPAGTKGREIEQLRAEAAEHADANAPPSSVVRHTTLEAVVHTNDHKGCRDIFRDCRGATQGVNEIRLRHGARQRH